MQNYKDIVDASFASLTGVPDAASWPVSERLTAFFFMMLDALEGAEVNASTFNREASGFGSPFQEALRARLLDVMHAVDVPGVNRVVTDTAPVRFIVAEILVQLLSTALSDDSDGRERSAALADRTLAWAASFLTSPVPGKSVDLVRYAVEAGYLPLNRIPGLSDLFAGSSTEEMHEGE